MLKIKSTVGTRELYQALYEFAQEKLDIYGGYIYIDADKEWLNDFVKRHRLNMNFK